MTKEETNANILKNLTTCKYQWLQNLITHELKPCAWLRVVARLHAGTSRETKPYRQLRWEWLVLWEFLLPCNKRPQTLRGGKKSQQHNNVAVIFFQYALWFTRVCVSVCYLLSLPCDEVPNCLAKKRCQEGVKWGWLLQEGVQSFQQRLLITQLIIDHSHITCQQLTRYIWIPVINEENATFSKMRQEQKHLIFKLEHLLC